MTMPRLLDLFCGAGGAAMGYHRAGFDVVGVDINPQPHYPFEFHQGDALEFLCAYRAGDCGADFDYFHASPPCQAHSTLRHLHENEYPDFIAAVRDVFDFMGVDYVIENVVGAPLVNPIRLCGSSFGLGVRRHRLFESNMPLLALPCSHATQPTPFDVSGTGLFQHSPRKKKTGGLGRKPYSLKHASEVMGGCEWMTRREVSQAIPPAYTEFIGEQVLAAVRQKVAT